MPEADPCMQPKCRLSYTVELQKRFKCLRHAPACTSWPSPACWQCACHSHPVQRAAQWLLQEAASFQPVEAFC